MLRLVFIACLMLAPAAHAARPKLIHQSQIVRAPAGYEAFGYEVAIDGDWAIVAAATPSPLPGQTRNHDALLYHRVNGQWTFDRLLVRRVQSAGSSTTVDFSSIAMSNGLAAIGTNPIQIFKRTNNSWAEISHPFTAAPGSPDHVSGALVWDGNTLLGEHECADSQSSWGAVIATVGADGTWSPLQRLSGSDSNCRLEPFSWDISGNTVPVGVGTDDPEEQPSQTRIFRRSGTQWSQTATIDDAARVGVRGDEMFLSLGGVAGTRVYRNDDTFTLTDRLRTVGAGYGYEGPPGFETSGDLVLVSWDVYRKEVAGKYQHVATLANRGQNSLIGAPAISGRTVISRASVSANGDIPAVMFHELPATYTPSPVIATGFNGTAPFTPLIGSFSVVTTANGNRVYHQTSTAGEHRALLNFSDWQEQSIEADIRPGASFFSGGLVVRHLDGANFYSAQLRSDNSIELQVMRNGELTTLRRQPLASTGSSNRHVALKIRNNHLQVFVEGREVIWYFDPQPIPHGSAALRGFGTVDYDNVVAAQVGQTFIYDIDYNGWCNGALIYTNYYTRTGSGTWSCDSVPTPEDSDNTMFQTSTADIARAIIAMTPTDDQVVTARARMTAVNGQNRWIGLATRYVDASNYYYLTLRSNNTVNLSKLVNGVVTVLATATLPVTLNTWYDVRLDAVGNELRAVLNGVQVLQATDTSHAKGRNGMITYKAAAEYTGYITWQP